MKNLSIVHINKGPAFLENTWSALEDLIGTQSPSILMLNEANYDPKVGVPIGLNGYNIEYNFGTNVATRARIMCMVKDNIIYKRRKDLEVQGLATIVLGLVAT